MPKIILGLAAELAGGKGTVAKHIIEKYDGSAHRFSTMLRDVLDRLYLDQNRENMQKLSTITRKAYGEDTLAKVISEDVKKDDHEVIVVDGVRRSADIKYLKELPEFKLIYIEADIEKRFERIKERGENPDDKSKTFEDFKKDHEGEADIRIRDLKKHADYIIDNNKDINYLHSQIDDVVSKYK
ncbi:hypothetical protein BMS3Abin15_00223 [bacterium BMS3Abin15]|nr:hypothetical protein BMS3Abin15_00223 [bacterium BMS3Abin15]HDH07738.1 hypothetical protein [Candidatus Moranbacteria bacterium]HDZ85073.1 hypothetical protein [Candidatus Moranbacteria bacterium]